MYALRRRWWVVLLVLVTSSGVAAIHTARQVPVFRATTTLVVRPNSSVAGAPNILRSLDTLERRSIIATFAKLPGTAKTRASVATRLGLDERTLRPYRIRGFVMPNTNIIQIEVHGPNRERVAAVANAAASKTQRAARRLYRIYALDELEEAVPARRPVHPNPQRNYVAGGILGLFLGVGAALVFDRLTGPPAATRGAPPHARGEG